MGQSVTRDVGLADEAATLDLGAALVRALPAERDGWLILLQGELGAGKTTLARAMLGALGHAGRVPSPTYTLVEPYDLPGGMIYHVDLYRISDESELEYLGWEDLGDGLTLVEWPERAPLVSGTADLRIALAYAGDGRRARIESLSERGAEALATLAA